jgi:hypothetical protein
VTRKKEYDTVMRGRAFTGLALRIAVAGYLVYLAWKIIMNMLSGSDAIPEWAVWLFCIGFIAAAAGFCVYAGVFFKRALKDAELLPATADITEDACGTDQEGDNGYENP